MPPIGGAPNLVSIDGSIGEGGGQVLRSALALSAIMETDLKITNIRAGREEPGLKPQHLAGVNAVAQLCNATVEGAAVGSTELKFKPDVLHGGEFQFDVGTAGSIALVLQAAIPPALRCGEPVQMTIKGGTDVMNAPTIDYVGAVLLPVLRGLGCKVAIEVVSRGFFPKGGGEVRVHVEPAPQINPFAPTGNHPRPVVHGVVINSGLSDDIANSTKRAMMRSIRNQRLGQIQVEHVESLSTGVSATMWCERRAGAVGGCSVGRRGYTAEQLGEDAAAPIGHAMRADADVDDHLLDQVLLYCIMATGRSSFTFDRMTPHAETLLAVAREFAPFTRDVQRDGRKQRMVIDGEGL